MQFDKSVLANMLSHEPKLTSCAKVLVYSKVVCYKKGKAVDMVSSWKGDIMAMQSERFAFAKKGLSLVLGFLLTLWLVNSFKVFKEVYMLYGAYPSSSIYMLQHYMNNQFFSLNMQKLTSAAYILFLFTVVCVA